MKTNILVNMKNVVNRTFTVKKQYTKVICAVVLLLGMSVSAWGTTLHYGAGGSSTMSYTAPTALPSVDDVGNWSAMGIWMKSSVVSSDVYPDYSDYYADKATNYSGEDDLYALYQNNTTYKYSTQPTACTDQDVLVADEDTEISQTGSYGSLTSFTLDVAADGTGNVTWTSTNTDVATVSGDNDDATVTVVGAGTTTIKASVAADATYCAGVGEYALTINAVAPTLSHNATGKALTVSGITSTGATFSGGVVTNKGGLDITRYGFTIGTSATVVIGGTGANAPVASGFWDDDIDLSTAFGSKTSVSNFSPNTTYYVRAFAYNGSVYGYSTAVQFKTLKQFSIDLEGGDGSDGLASVDENSTSIEVVTAPSRDHYTLEGYYTTSGVSTKIADTEGNLVASITVSSDAWTDGDGKWVLDDDATFYAKWTPDNHTISFNANGGSSSMDNVVKAYNSSYSLPSCTMTAPTGYEFKCWAQGSASGTERAVGYSHTVTGDITFYAVWQKKDYKLVVASTDNVTITATPASGSALAEGADPIDVQYEKTVTLNYSTITGNKNWAGWKVYKTGDASTTVSVTGTGDGATFTMPAYDVTVSANLFGDFVFSCAELTLTKKLVTANAPIFVTSTAGKTVRSQDSILIVGSGLTPNQELEFPDLPSQFAVKSRTNGTLAVAADGSINAVAYIYYTPDAGATDILNKTTALTVKVGGAKPIQKTLTHDVIGRRLPTNFVIAVKHTDNQWYALPADMSGTGNPAPVAIRVDNMSSPTTAYCDNTNAYNLYASTLNTLSVQLAMPNNPNMANAALWANNAVSSTNIGKNGATNGSSTGLGGNYQWVFTQTATSVSGVGDVKYTMSNPNNANPLKLWTNGGSTLWGLYSSGSAEIRLLSLVDVKPMTMKVMEWGTNAIVVSYPNGSSATSPQVRIDAGDAADVTLTSLGGDIYKIATISGLQDNPAKTLIITATESSTAKQALFPIPLIVTGTKTEAELRTAAGSNDIAKLTDVIIRDGGRLTTGTNSGNFNDVYIYPGGKAKITNNFAANNIYMRGGYSFLDEKATFKYPDLCVEDGGSTTTIDLPAANKLYYDFYIDNRKYYMFSMPQDVTLASVTDEAGYDDFPVWVKHYDGNLRASGRGVSGWTWYGDEEGQESFFAGIGYEITAKPKTSGRPIAIIRFPVITGDITTDAENSPEITVTYHGKSAYEAGTQTANNVGWNFIGNPYLTEYKAVTDTSMIVKSDFVQHKENDQWDGSYEWKVTTARFITVPYDTYNDYHHELVKGYTIPAFSTFFFQFAEDATGTFHMGGDRPQAALAPARFGAAPEAKPEINIDVMLRGEDELEGKAGLIIHEKYEGGLKDFEDVEQWFVDNNVLKTYTFANNVALAYNLLNEEAATELIPMGYIATVAGQHTYALNEENDVSALEHLWLIDYSTGVTTDLLVRDYSFITAAGRFDSRFAINAVLKQEEVATNISNAADGDWTKNIGVYNDGNMLTLRGLPDNSAVYIYDMNGRLLLNGENLSSVASFSIATQGVYNIRVIAEGKAITLRTVIR